MHLGMIGRSKEEQALALGLVSESSVFWIGPPGTGKTMMAERFAKAAGVSSFCHLLTKFTTPDEILGPWDIKGVQLGKWERLIDGYMPSAEIVFLDEVWKASAAILNALLDILENKRVKQGSSYIKTPTKMVIAASNEYPEPGLEAIFDRFLIRQEVKPLTHKDRGQLLRYVSNGGLPKPGKLEGLIGASTEAAKIPVSKEAVSVLEEILIKLADDKITVSDRRAARAIDIAKAAAWLKGAKEVAPQHLEPLIWVLWTNHEHQSKASEIILSVCNPAQNMVTQILIEAEQIRDSAKESNLSATITKLKECRNRLLAINNDYAKEAVIEIGNMFDHLKKTFMGDF